MDRYYIAIDGGGTKTDAVLFTANGRLVNRVIGAGTNPNGMDFTRVTEHFRALFSRLLSSSKPERIAGCFAGLSGSDHPALVQRLTDCLRAACPVRIEHLSVGSDAMNALWSGTDGGPGLVIIAGTGSIAFGIPESGESFRIGGWGYLFGDEGSGYAIGRETIRRVLMAYDGREKETELTKALTDYFHVQAIVDIVPVVYGTTKDVIAGLVPIVAGRANQGDWLAGEILNDAAEQLISLIRSGIARFFQEPETVLVGGVWKCRAIRRTVCSRLTQPFIFPEFPPVYGSMAKCVNEWEHQKKQLLDQLKLQLKTYNPA